MLNEMENQTASESARGCELKVEANVSGNTERGAVRCSAWLGNSCRLHNNISRQSFEALPTPLHHSDRYVSGFAGVDVSYDAGFARVHTTSDLALSAVFEFGWLFSFHLCCWICVQTILGFQDFAT
jgi:hypothetical protein